MRIAPAPICAVWGYAPLIGAMLAFVIAVHGQTTSPPPLTTEPEPSLSAPTTSNALPIPAVPDNFLLGPDDLLEVNVLGMPDLSALVRVDGSGRITLPLLRQQIPAAQHTAPDVARALAAALQQEGLARQPQVRITVEQVLSKPVVIAGAVRTPGVVQATHPLSLVEVLSRAGGVTALGGGSVVVSQNGTDSSFDLNAVLNSSNPPATPWLRGGETVRVLPSRLIYVIGALQKPGSFPLATGEPINVLKAVALAQGLSQTDPPDTQHTQILRTQSNGQRVAIPVNLDQVLKRQIPDPDLKAGDILYIPGNGRQRFLRAFLQDAGQAAVIALGYSTHF